MSPRRRALFIAAATLAVAWAVAWIGRGIAERSRMTAEKVRTYVASVDFGSLRGQDRQRALRALADKLNALPFEERRQVRLRREWEGWFTQMTEAEKEQFVEATFPAGLKQIINAFERMPEDRRRRTIEESLRRLREAQAGDQGAMGSRGAGRDEEERPPISPELEAKVRTLGLKTFFAESSAQTKAEVAPLLEEIQRIIENGGRIHRRPLR